MKMKRFSIDFTPGATEEFERVQKITELGAKEIFCNAFLLFRIYVDAIIKDKKLIIVDTDADGDLNLEEIKKCQVIELPLFVKKSQRE